MASVSGIYFAEVGEYPAIPSLIVESDGIRIQRIYSPEHLPRWLTNALVVSFAFTRELERSKGCILEREREKERREIFALVCLAVYPFVNFSLVGVASSRFFALSRMRPFIPRYQQRIVSLLPHSIRSHSPILTRRRPQRHVFYPVFLTRIACKPRPFHPR